MHDMGWTNILALPSSFGTKVPERSCVMFGYCDRWAVGGNTLTTGIGHVECVSSNGTWTPYTWRKYRWIPNEDKPFICKASFCCCAELNSTLTRRSCRQNVQEQFSSLC